MKNKTLVRLSLVVLALCNFSALHAENTISRDHQLEDLQSSSDDISAKSDTLLEHSKENKGVFIDQPLGNRKHGIELNLFRLIAWGEELGAISGSYSYFDTQNNVEWAFPFFYARDDELTYSTVEDRSVTSSTFTLDVHYRKYLGHRLNGLYLSGFTRAARIHSFVDPYNTFKTGTANKLGLGVGIGWRKISQNNLYWGMSLSFGRYVTGKSNKFDSEHAAIAIDDNKLIFDIELLKFGYTF